MPELNNKEHLGLVVHYVELRGREFPGFITQIVTNEIATKSAGRIVEDAEDYDTVDLSLMRAGSQGLHCVNSVEYSGEELKGTWHFPEDCSQDGEI